MDHQQSVPAGSGKQRLARRHRARELPDIVAQGIAEAAGLQEVALHIDDNDGAVIGIDLHGCRVGFDGNHRKARYICFCRSAKQEPDQPHHRRGAAQKKRPQLTQVHRQLGFFIAGAPRSVATGLSAATPADSAEAAGALR
jgi:hypothetical protein